MLIQFLQPNLCLLIQLVSVQLPGQWPPPGLEQTCGLASDLRPNYSLASDLRPNWPTLGLNLETGPAMGTPHYTLPPHYNTLHTTPLYAALHCSNICIHQCSAVVKFCSVQIISVQLITDECGVRVSRAQSDPVLRIQPVSLHHLICSLPNRLPPPQDSSYCHIYLQTHCS